MADTQGVTCLHENAAGPILWPVASIGENIRRVRSEHPEFHHQGKFARALGIPQGRVSDWERGRYENIGLPTLLKIAAVLERPIEDLVVGLDKNYDSLGKTRSVTPARTNGPSNREGVIAAKPAFDPELVERLARAEAGFAATLEELGAVRAELTRVIAPQSEKRRARRR